MGKDGIIAKVTGKVGKRFATSKSGNAFTLLVQREGAQFPDRVTVWGVEFDVDEGDRVTVEGWLSWSKSKREDREYFNVSVNRPKLLERELGAPVDDGEEPF